MRFPPPRNAGSIKRSRARLEGPELDQVIIGLYPERGDNEPLGDTARLGTEEGAPGTSTEFPLFIPHGQLARNGFTFSPTYPRGSEKGTAADTDATTSLTVRAIAGDSTVSCHIHRIQRVGYSTFSSRHRRGQRGSSTDAPAPVAPPPHPTTPSSAGRPILSRGSPSPRLHLTKSRPRGLVSPTARLARGPYPDDRQGFSLGRAAGGVELEMEMGKGACCFVGRWLGME